MSGMYTPSRLYANSNVQGGFPSGREHLEHLQTMPENGKRGTGHTKRNEERIIGVAEFCLAENRGRKIETTLCKSANLLLLLTSF